ncbi:MAG: hypothetical protein B6V02_03455 [Thermoprotei archaeon ex4572_64]|nr:MAG: hypothetical protein B6V02_03455 [Thermoprotei archaeon ex4572_64]
MTIRVLKFGGSVLSSGGDYLRAAYEIKKYLDEGSKIIVVVSAMKGVTDDLLRIVEKPTNWYERVTKLQEKHVEALKTMSLSDELSTTVFREISTLFDELIKLAHAISITHEVTPRLRDYVLSFGERLSAILMWSALTSIGIESTYLTGRDAGIITDENYGEAKPIMELTRRSVSETLTKYLNAGVVPVVTGFIAGTIDGRVTTLGRGGSDYTATLIASIINAKEVVLYTDVPGVLTGDPKFMSNVKLVNELSYEEAIACAQLGAKKFHPRTFEPVIDTNINTVITCMDCRDRTVVSSRLSPPPVKIVTLMRDLSLVILKGAALTKLSNIVHILAALSSKDVNTVSFIQQPTQTATSIIVKNDKLSEVLALINELKRLEVINDYNYITNISIVSVIGYGLRDPSIVGYLLEDIVDIPTYGILRGPYDVSLSVIIDSENAIKLAAKLHERMVKKWWINSI